MSTQQHHVTMLLEAGRTKETERMTDGFDEITELVSSGLSVAEAVDYYATEKRDYNQTEWAEVRGTSRQAVSRNARQGRRKLLDE